MSDAEQITAALPVMGASLEALAGRLQESPLNLDYAFVPSPYPILASPEGGNPSVIDLQVLISDRRTRPVGIRKITITIETGQNTPAAISSAPKLPDPVYDGSRAAPWEITVKESTITIEPKYEDDVKVTDTIIFTLPRIQVNNKPGSVMIEVTEIDAAGRKAENRKAHQLVKLPSRTPVTNFRAEPAHLTDYGLQTTLYWHCTTMGENLSYRLRSYHEQARRWTQQEWRQAGDLLSCADGSNGVRTPGLVAGTYFELDVLAADAAGHQVIIDTLRTYVRVDPPSIVETSSCTPVTRSGKLLRMKWLARNATRCSIMLNGVVVRENLPADTYTKGYLLTIEAPPGKHQIALIAHGASGVTAQRVFPDIVVGSSLNIPLNGFVGGAVITPDGKHAYVSLFPRPAMLMSAIAGASAAANYSGTIQMIDLKKGTRERSIAVGIIPGDLALTEDRNYIVAAPYLFLSALSQARMDAVAAVDLRTHEASIHTVPSARVISVSSARKGSLVAATAVLDPQIEAAEYLVDVSGKAVNQPKMSGGVDFLLSSAVTPDGRTALGAGFYGHVVSVFNVEQRTRDPKSIRVDGTPISIAINREGTLALVAGDDRHLHVIDLATRTLEPGGIDIGPSDPECLFFFMLPASQMAITPDGAFAFVLRRSGTEVAIVDIEARALIGTISVPDSGTVPPYFAIGIAIGDDGTIILCNGLAITLL